MDHIIHVFLSPKNEITMWIKLPYLWHKWLPQTPSGYAKVMAKITKQNESGPTWWGMHEESPEDHGYKLLGTLNENVEK